MQNNTTKRTNPKENIPVCPLFKKCGGCQLQNLDYFSQLKYKQSTVSRLLFKFGHVNTIIGMKDPSHYRNKVQAAFGYDKSRHKIISGVYQSGSHRIVPVDSCYIEDETADKIIVSVRKLCEEFKFKSFDEDNGTGFIRHVLVKHGFKSGEIMVVIVSASPLFPSKNNFVKALLKLHPEITTIIHNINPYKTNLVLGNKENILYGNGYIEEELLDCRFRISAKSFYQINPTQTEVLYKKAIEFAHLTGKETVMDCYCGTGTIGIIAAKNGAKRVIGTELNPNAVKDAKYNAEKNNINNIEFVCADATDFINEMYEYKENCNVIIMDPPRSGSTKLFVDAASKLANKIVYISCNPETLARDLGWFSLNKFKVNKIQPVDMFPFTKHVETVVLLSKI